MSVRIGVDVGGTFTDIVCFDEEQSRLTLLKVPSTPKAPDRAVIDGALRILRESGLSAQSVSFFIHGTTIATNTLLEGKGARVALLVTEGFRDVLQIMRQDRPRLYDYFIQRPEPLVSRNLRFEIRERMLYTGEARTALAEEPTRATLRKIAGLGIEDVAVCLLHSYANPEHEHQLGSWIVEEIPGARVSLSNEILCEFKEFERMSTTVVNAYVLPRVSKYVENLKNGLVEVGVRSGLQIMQSNGGLMTAEAAQKHCVQTILSGPAAGALTGLRLSQQAGFGSMISIDVGGTSADVALAHDGRLHFAEENEIAGHVIKVPMIEIQTVGAGGGSIGWIDAGGALQVGPHSAGAEPGPACYGFGGTEPTVTDANVVLGRVNPSYFLGGEMKIDPQLSEKAVREKICQPLGLGLEEAAEGMLRVINAVMTKAIRKLSVERGYDPRDFTLIGFGGGGPLHAVDLALDLQIPRVLVPPAPGVSSALGLLTADFRHDYVRTLLWSTREHTLADLEEQLSFLKGQVLSQMASEGIAAETVACLPHLDMRYQGQGYALDIHFTLEEAISWDSLRPLEGRFHEKHQSVYGYGDAHHPVEIVNLRLAGVGKLSRPKFPLLAAGPADPTAALKGHRQVFLRGSWQTVAIYDRRLLKAGSLIRGPAIIEQVDSTTFFYADQEAEVDALGNIMIRV